MIGWETKLNTWQVAEGKGIDITPAQHECLFLDEGERYKIITKGRRFGLTWGACIYIIKKMIDQPIQVLWGDVNYNNIRKYIQRMFIPALKRQFGLNEKEHFTINLTANELIISVNGHVSRLDFRSAEKPESWEGQGYHLIFLNEAGIILQDAEYLYYNAILPMLIDYENSQLIAGGVPKGKRGIFWELWQRCEAGEEGYKGYNYSSFDNIFVDVDAIKRVESAMSETTAKQEIYGKFVDNVNNPFCYAFIRSKHVKPCPFIKELPVYLSFDFNVNPITCVVAQESAGEIRFIKEFRLSNSNIFELCQRVRSEFPNIGGITGDATGFGRSAMSAGNVCYYDIIKNELNVPTNLIRTPTSNDSHANSRALCNCILTMHKGLFIDPSCEFLIQDLLYVESDNTGKINKNKDKHQTHLLDCFRYYLATFHGRFITENKYEFQYF